MITSGNREPSRASKVNARRPLAACLLALGALACSDRGGRADTSVATDSLTLPAPTTASTAAGTVAPPGSDSATVVAAPAPAATPQAATTPAATPSPTAAGGGEQMKTRVATPPGETKRLDVATRTAARQGATTRDTAPSGAVTPAPPVRKTAAPAATAPASTPPTAAAPAAATPARSTSSGAAAAPAQQTTQPAAQTAAQGSGDRLTATPAAYQGWKTFHVYCYRCHGTDALGSDLAPNLRHSIGPQGSLNQAAFLTTVKEGRLEKGMPAWKQMLTDEQIQNLYVYVKARSTGELAAGRPRQARP
jgi:mono/diheme cytochrome c family protein